MRKNFTRLYWYQPKNFAFCKIYITTRKRNTFISIYDQKVKNNKLVFKSSIGLTGYLGPKRKTNMGKERVAGHARFFLKKKDYTCIDIIFKKKIRHWFRYIARGLFPYKRRLYIRHIYVLQRQGHGFIRKKKKRRM